MMIYLLFFRTVHLFGLSTPPGHTNMIQMILTLKIIGLAFERDSVLTKLRDADKKDDKQIELTPAESDLENISFINIFHYCFNYIGLLTGKALISLITLYHVNDILGPYFTYKTFFDYFHYPFAVSADCWKATFEKLKLVPLYFGLYLAASYVWPIEYAISDEFYLDRSWLYRLFYVWPSFFIFRMRIYSGIILSECNCISAGLGAYPKELKAKCGHGPSKAISQEFIDKPANRDYDFDTVENINILGVEKCLTFREAMKHWNRCVQYWLAMYVYKRFPSKKYRIIATMAVSAYWHGVHAGHYFCILGPIVYLPLEDLYLKVFQSETESTQRKHITNLFFWTMKFFAFSYMGTAFLLRDVGKIWFYYKSVYHFAYVFWAAFYCVCFFLWKQKKIAMKKAAQQTEASATQLSVETKKID